MPPEALAREDPSVSTSIGFPEILDLLPQRYPMLMVDRIDSLDPGRSAEGVKCVTANEPFLPGHFPDHPIMPGVLIVEALAQMAGVMLRSSRRGGQQAAPGAREGGGQGVLASIQRMRFLRPVLPGDVLSLKVTLTKSLGSLHQVKGEAFVGGVLAASGDLVVGS